MTGQTIICPSCSTSFKLDESLAAPLIAATRKEYEQKLAAKDATIAQREAAVQSQQDELARQRAELDEQIAAKLNAEREKIATEEAKKARVLMNDQLSQKAKELADLEEVLAHKNEKLAEAHQVQAEFLQKQRELEDAKRELAVTVEKRVQESMVTIREKALAEVDERYRLQIVEREEEKASLQRKVDELQRKLQQGSQQLQGEAQEIELECLLRGRFPQDIIEPVGKGESGGDVLQRVVSPSGQSAGTILWESKRTKNWSDGWLAKLREDQRAAKADVALIVSSALPKGLTNFDLIEGVWVVEVKCALSVATVLRQSLVEVAAARKSVDGQQTKMEMVYEYLTGPRFRQRVEAIVERFRGMEDDLAKERTMMTKQWAKREAQIRGVIGDTVGMYGDLQGIAGNALAEINSLELPLIETQSSSVV
jgi:hypothetical protein